MAPAPPTDIDRFRASHVYELPFTLTTAKYTAESAKHIADTYLQRSGIVDLEFSCVRDEVASDGASLWVVIYSRLDDPEAEWQFQSGPVCVEVDKTTGEPSLTLMP
ncbi:hypothetical protein CEE69_20985 [Rhodopirellula bahusiensis]|uniref:Uncharacterized protein n=1 Tax=Rhodopirellula bahusiensis TaxID=2014065 RepID=A0A2G1W2X9_9BACT|nr:hypothetical protein CEE69_20985 [Rhodopirellula bahusiensis]